MTRATQQMLLQRITRALGHVRAEYESDDELYQSFAAPLYVKKLHGITPTFLVGGRGTGKTTTLRSMSHRGQARIADSIDPEQWPVVGAYWKVEPNVVSAFRQRGIDEEGWTRVFSHYLNLRLSALVVDHASWMAKQGRAIHLDNHRAKLLARSLHIEDFSSLPSLAEAIDLGMVDVEAKLNGNISGLVDSPLSLLGKPLEYLFQTLTSLTTSRDRPFMFCLDEYENFEPYQKRILNTLIKQVGASPYTFKIGVRNTVSIEQATLVQNQPLQDPADFTTVDIVTDLKDESFEQFAATVIGQRLSLVQEDHLGPERLLPSITLEEEAALLGAEHLRAELLDAIQSDPTHSSDDLAHVHGLPMLEAAMVVRWAATHDEKPLETLRFAKQYPRKWIVRVGNYGYASLFAIREKRVGARKYYAGWRTYCQLADGNIRYMIRLVHEAVRLHVTDGAGLDLPVSIEDQTTAAARVGETTIRDLQGWSRQGAALTRLTLGLGSIFGTLAREAAFSTPEVNQFRVQHTGSMALSDRVDVLLNEAVGQGVIIGFDGDKNARMSGATREADYQLHPVLAPYFVYSPRRKRRMTIRATDLIALTSREDASATIRKFLTRRGATAPQLPDELRIFEEPR